MKPIHHSSFTIHHSTAVILAAGAGTRLGALGRVHSKPMVPVAGRPLIDWVIRSLRRAGVGPLIVVGHPSDSQLAAFLGEQHPAITLVVQPQRRGIADALCHALPLVAQQAAFLACACDSLIPPADIGRLIALGQQHVGSAVIGVLDMGREATASRSAVRLEGDRVVEIVEKPAPGMAASGLVALPLYWLPQSVASHIEAAPSVRGERYVSTALNAFIRSGGLVHAVWVSERMEITTAADVDGAARWLQTHRGIGLG